MNLNEQINQVAAAGTAKIKAPAKRKPAPSLTAQLKKAKAELKAAQSSLKFAQERADSFELLAESYSSSVLSTPEGMIEALGSYRIRNSCDSQTDAVILRLINRLTNLG